MSRCCGPQTTLLLCEYHPFQAEGLTGVQFSLLTAVLPLDSCPGHVLFMCAHTVHHHDGHTLSAAASPTVISALDARGQGHGGPTLGGDGGDDGPEIKPDMWATSLATKPSVAEAFKTTLAASQNKFADRRLSRRLMQGSAGPASFQFAEPGE